VKSSDFGTEYSHFNVTVKSFDSYSEKPEINVGYL